MERQDKNISRLAQLRLDAGLTQIALANRLQLHKQELSDMERGKREIRLTPYQFATLLDSIELSPWGLVKALEKPD
jgi:transcriptional regulator with XRE-family HTH domain